MKIGTHKQMSVRWPSCLLFQSSYQIKQSGFVSWFSQCGSQNLATSKSMNHCLATKLLGPAVPTWCLAAQRTYLFCGKLFPYKNMHFLDTSVNSSIIEIRFSFKHFETHREGLMTIPHHTNNRKQYIVSGYFRSFYDRNFYI